MNFDTPTFTIRYDRQREHVTEVEQLKARIADLEAQLAQPVEPEPLSPAQMRVLNLMGYCLTREQIAERLCLSNRTVQRHECSIFKRIGVANRTQAARWAWRNGYVDMDDAWQTVTAMQWGMTA